MPLNLGQRWKAELERDRERANETRTTQASSVAHPTRNSATLADMEDDSLDSSGEAQSEQQPQNQTLDVKYLSGFASGSDDDEEEGDLYVDDAESDNDEQEVGSEAEDDAQEVKQEKWRKSAVRAKLLRVVLLLMMVVVVVWRLSYCYCWCCCFY